MEELARVHRLQLSHARELLCRAEVAAAEDPQARPVRQWFAALREEEARGAPGRVTRANRPGRPAVLAPGRQTLVMLEAEREEARAPREDVPREPRARREPAGASQREPGRLDLATQWRMSQAFGFDFNGVSIRRDSPLATGSTRALVQDGEIHFREGAYRPGTRDGDWLIAHELAHVVQQQAGRGDRTGSRRELEREADRAATLATLGRAAPIALRAQPAAAYAYSDAEEHDQDIDEPAASSVEAEDAGAEADASTGVDPEAKRVEPETKPVEPEVKPAEPEPKPADAVSEAAPDKAAEGPDLDEGAEPAADMDDAGPGSATMEEGGEAAGGAPLAAAGGAPARQEKQAPDVAAIRPEAGLAQLAGVRRDKLLPALGQVHAATTTDVDKARAEQRANPPKQLSIGEAAAPKEAGTPGLRGETAEGAPGTKGSAPAAGEIAASAAKAAAPGGADPADPPVQAEVPGGQAAKQARQGEAAQQQQTAGQVVVEAAQAIASWFSSWLGGSGKREGGELAGMSEAETKQMSGSLEKLPASASDLATDPGPAPELAMKGEARATADADRAKLEAKAARLEQQGHADSRVPLGEDQIETSVPTEELTAQAAARGAASDAALPTVEAAAPSEEVGIVAKEQHGAEIDAALAKGSADVTAERGKHAEEEAQARADADQQVRDLKTKADADHAAAKATAKAEAEQARGAWQAEIDRKGADARKQADKKIGEGMAQVEAEEAKANAEAKQHIDQGKQKAEAEKQKGEREAADAKAKGKQKSSGFLGWLSSKAKAFVDGIKKAISAAIDAARKAVKAVLDAAKKLAMAAIELARKAITAAIKAIGDALIAISEVLLAAFPALKAKFQAAIRKAVAAATAAVDKIAAGLKKAVQAALDLLGAALDKALGLLEKGLHAIVDVVGAVVQGYIDAARAIVEALGTWARLLKDIASGPGAWLGKLGAAIVDGIKHHLWAALKTAVIEWFKSKVFELLGVAGLILQVLLEGGITQDDIVQMALDALIVAIPAALIAILIEKLVAMIVPAAGALMAILEGLQAAWGTISRIIAAFAAFMAFLRAVQGGGAGPLFATALASAAVVLLDFVANWLLRKLRGPAARVGARLKGMAAKLGRRGKGKGPRRRGDRDATPGAKPPTKKPGSDGSDGKPTRKPDKDKKQDERDALRVAQDTARRAWDLARRRTNDEVVSVAALETAIRGLEGIRRGFRVTVDVVVNGRSWNIRARATKGSASGMATKGRGWVALDGGARWLAEKDQTRKHDGIVRDADRLLDHEARELSKQYGQLRDLHQALRPRIQKIERTLTERLLKGIRFTINENEYTEGKDEQGDTALLYSWEIRPNASKNKIAASGGKKRGDHVFAHGLTKLPVELRNVASTKELIGSKAGLAAAISSISSSVTHAAFELVVHKPEVAGKEGDAQSQAFGGALSGFRAVFETFLDKLELVDLAVAMETSPAEEVVAANAALAAVKRQWTSLIGTVHDRDCTPHLDNKSKGLERQGVTILTTLETSFPQALSAVVAASGKPQAQAADPSTPEANAPDAVDPDAKTPDAKDNGS